MKINKNKPAMITHKNEEGETVTTTYTPDFVTDIYFDWSGLCIISPEYEVKIHNEDLIEIDQDI